MSILPPFAFLSPENIATFGANVSGSAVATDHELAWLCDGLPGFPLRGTSGGGAWTAALLAAMPVDVLVLGNHDIDGSSTVSISGDVSASIVTAAMRPNNIPWASYVRLPAPVLGVDSLTVTVASNSKDVVIGEFLAGLLTQLANKSSGLVVNNVRFVAGADLPSPFSGLQGNFKGVVQREVDFHVDCGDEADYLTLQAWWEATEGATLPSVIFPMRANDAWVGRLLDFKPSWDNNKWTVNMTFQEYPRRRWIG